METKEADSATPGRLPARQGAEDANGPKRPRRKQLWASMKQKATDKLRRDLTGVQVEELRQLLCPNDSRATQADILDTTLEYIQTHHAALALEVRNGGLAKTTPPPDGSMVAGNKAKEAVAEEHRAGGWSHVILDHLGVIVAVLRPTGEVLHASQAAKTVLGLVEQSKPFIQDYIDVADRGALQQQLKACLDAGPGHYYRFRTQLNLKRVAKATPSTIVLGVRLSAVQSAEGLVGFLEGCTLFPVECLQTDDTLSPNMVSTHDMHGRLMSASGYAYDICGHSADTMVGSQAFMFHQDSCVPEGLLKDLQTRHKGSGALPAKAMRVTYRCFNVRLKDYVWVTSEIDVQICARGQPFVEATTWLDHPLNGTGVSTVAGRLSLKDLKAAVNELEKENKRLRADLEHLPTQHGGVGRGCPPVGANTTESGSGLSAPHAGSFLQPGACHAAKNGHQPDRNHAPEGAYHQGGWHAKGRPFHDSSSCPPEAPNTTNPLNCAVHPNTGYQEAADQGVASGNHTSCTAHKLEAAPHPTATDPRGTRRSSHADDPHTAGSSQACGDPEGASRNAGGRQLQRAGETHALGLFQRSGHWHGNAYLQRMGHSPAAGNPQQAGHHPVGDQHHRSGHSFVSRHNQDVVPPNGTTNDQTSRHPQSSHSCGGSCLSVAGCPVRNAQHRPTPYVTTHVCQRCKKSQGSWSHSNCPPGGHFTQHTGIHGHRPRVCWSTHAPRGQHCVEEQVPSLCQPCSRCRPRASTFMAKCTHHILIDRVCAAHSIRYEPYCVRHAEPELPEYLPLKALPGPEKTEDSPAQPRQVHAMELTDKPADHHCSTPVCAKEYSDRASSQGTAHCTCCAHAPCLSSAHAHAICNDDCQVGGCRRRMLQWVDKYSLPTAGYSQHHRLQAAFDNGRGASFVAVAFAKVQENKGQGVHARPA